MVGRRIPGQRPERGPLLSRTTLATNDQVRGAAQCTAQCTAQGTVRWQIEKTRLAHIGQVNANNTHFSWFHLAMEEIR